MTTEPPPGQGYVPPAAPASSEDNPLAIAALVLGIIAIIGAFFTAGALGVILGIIAVVLGVLGRRKVTSGRTTRSSSTVCSARWRPGAPG